MGIVTYSEVFQAEGDYQRTKLFNALMRLASAMLNFIEGTAGEETDNFKSVDFQRVSDLMNAIIEVRFFWRGGYGLDCEWPDNIKPEVSNLSSLVDCFYRSFNLHETEAELLEFWKKQTCPRDGEIGFWSEKINIENMSLGFEIESVQDPEEDLFYFRVSKTELKNASEYSSTRKFDEEIKLFEDVQIFTAPADEEIEQLLRITHVFLGFSLTTPLTGPSERRTATGGEVRHFIPGPLQTGILNALARSAMKKEELAAKVGTDPSRLYRKNGIKELMLKGLVQKSPRGYYRPDAPPDDALLSE